MAFLCSVMGHTAVTKRHQNQGLEFSLCHHCACDLIRIEESNDWTEVPAGFRVVWREFGRPADATSVASRMARMAPPRRRDPRGARAKPHRDPRGRPFGGATAMVGMLANLGRLVRDDAVADTGTADAHGQSVIRLPSIGTH